jgi:hypothetical protein
MVGKRVYRRTGDRGGPLPAGRVWHGAELCVDELGLSEEPANPTPIEWGQARALRGQRGSEGDKRGPGEAGGVRDGIGGPVVTDPRNSTFSVGVQREWVCGGEN